MGMSSLFALLVAKVGLVELRLGSGWCADLLIGVSLIECAGARALGMHLVGDGVLGVACVGFVSFLRAKCASK